MRKYFITSVISAAIIISCSLLIFNKSQNKNIENSPTVTQEVSVTDSSEDLIIIDDQTIDVENDEYAVISEEAAKENTAEDTDENTAEDPCPYVIPTVTDDMYKEFDEEIDIYNSIALNKFLGDMHITMDEINEALSNNSNIDSQWNEIISEFAQRIINKYPEVDMRLFYENIKRLSIEYDSYEKLKEKGFMAYYSPNEGIIHVNESIDLSNTYYLMIVRHELGHMLSLGILKNDIGKTIVCTTNFKDYGEYFREATAVIISSKPYENEYTFTDFGYTIIANELESVLLAIPDFDMSILVNRDVYDIAAYLEQINPNDVPAYRFISLMDQQAIKFYSNSSDAPVEEDFTDIYRYIANTYMNHVLNENMSQEEIQAISDSIKENLSKNLYYKDTPVEYEEIDKIFNDAY